MYMYFYPCNVHIPTPVSIDAIYGRKLQCDPYNMFWGLIFMTASLLKGLFFGPGSSLNTYMSVESGTNFIFWRHIRRNLIDQENTTSTQLSQLLILAGQLVV